MNTSKATFKASTSRDGDENVTILSKDGIAIHVLKWPVNDNHIMPTLISDSIIFFIIEDIFNERGDTPPECTCRNGIYYVQDDGGKRCCVCQNTPCMERWARKSQVMINPVEIDGIHIPVNEDSRIIKLEHTTTETSQEATESH